MNRDKIKYRYVHTLDVRQKKMRQRVLDVKNGKTPGLFRALVWMLISAISRRMR